MSSGRDQITRLHDTNGDNEADFYENFNNDGEVTHNTHEFATCLETDKEGNFYYLRGDSGGASRQDGCLLRVSPTALSSTSSPPAAQRQRTGNRSRRE